MNATAYMRGWTIASKGFFAVLPFTIPPTVYGMSIENGRGGTKAMVSVAGKTYTEEELEYMAAMRVAANFHLPNEKLKALAAKNPPPPEWYATKEDAPF